MRAARHSWVIAALVALAGCEGSGKGVSGIDGESIDCGQFTLPGCDERRPYHVRVDGNGGGEGRSWEGALDDVQDAVNRAYCSARKCGDRFQVWVAEGDYSVYRGSRDNTLRLREGVDLYGGFTGEENELEERGVPGANESVLDGEEMVCHVVTGADDALINGFTIRGGMAVDGHEESTPGGCSAGGGMLNHMVSPTVEECRFEENKATRGAGMCNIGFEGVVDDCGFYGNNASERGGGLENLGGVVSMIHVTIDGNHAGEEGGGMVSSGECQVTMERCGVLANEAPRGGGIVVREGSLEMSNGVVLYNEAEEHAGLLSLESARLKVTSVDICFNESMAGGAMGIENAFGEVSSSIFHGNVGQQVSSDQASMTYVEYSLLEGGDLSGINSMGVIDGDPGFQDDTMGDLRLTAGSPCIDAANGEEAPSTDLMGNARVDDPATGNTGNGPPWADIGAYEYQP